MTSDFYGSDVVYHGHVAGISAGTGAAFELLPPQNATGNWIKIVRRVPVRIVLNADDVHSHPLRIGLSMETTVDRTTPAARCWQAEPVAAALQHTGLSPTHDGCRASDQPCRGRQRRRSGNALACPVRDP